MLIDSHCHLNLLNLDPFDGDLDAVMQHMADNQVGQAICVSTILSEANTLRGIAEKYPNISYSIGVHPNEMPGEPVTVEELVRLSEHPKVVAIGETGLDYFRSEGNLDWQRERFTNHILAAKQLSLPIIVHTREAREDTLVHLAEAHAQGVRGVLHCFSEDWEMAKQAIDWGFYISFSGIVTFKNAKALQEVAKKIPLTSMLVETDSPWLAPTPHRGKPNFPGYVRHVADFIAGLRGEAIETIEKQTTLNCQELFSLKALPVT